MSADSERAVRLDPQNPWPGLLSFREQDQEFFGGRDVAAEALCRRVIAEPLTLVFGPSGLGKTSLLRAGLFPRLRQQHFFPVYIRLEYVSGRTPLQQIKDEIVKQAASSGVEATPPRDDESLPEYLHRDDVDFWDERNFPCRPVLVFDQFEELFTKGREAAGALADELSPLTEGGRAAARYRVVFSMREEYVAQLHGISDRFRSVFGNRFPVRRMSGSDALASILKAGAEVIDEAVARRVIRFVGGIRDDPSTEPAPGEQLPVEKLQIEPALLSVICSELNVTRKDAQAEKITVSMLAGRRQAILAAFYERSFTGVSDAMRRLVEDQLVMSDGRTRDSMAVQKALETEGVSEEDLQRLVDRRVIRVQEIGELKRMELTHDLLAPEAAASRAARRSRERDEAERKAQAERLEAALKAQEQAERARDAARRSLRRSRLLAASFAVLLLAIGGFAFYIRFLRTETRRRETREAVRSANRAFTDGRQSEGLAYLAHALKRDPKNQVVRSMIYDRLLHQPWWVMESSLPLPQQDLDVAAVSPDGSRVVSRDYGGRTVRLWDVASGQEVKRVQRQTAFGPAKFVTSRFVYFGPGDAVLWDTEAAGEGLHPVPAGADVRSDAKEIAQPFGMAIRFIDVASGRWTTAALPDAVQALRYSPDGKHMLLVTDRGYQVWDVVAGKALGEPRRIQGVGLVGISRGGGTLVTRDRTGWRMFGAASGEAQGPSIPSMRIVVNADATRVVALLGSEARLYDGNGRMLATLRDDERVTDAVLNEEGNRLLTLADDGTVRCWTVDGARVGAPLLHRRSVNRAAFTSDGGVLTIGDRVRRWSMRESAPGQALPAFSAAVDDEGHVGRGVAVIEDAGGEKGHAIIGLETGRVLWRRSSQETAFQAISPDGRFIAFTEHLADGSLRVIVHDARNGTVLWQQDYLSANDAQAAFGGDVLVLRVAEAEPVKSTFRFLSAERGEQVGRPFEDPGYDMVVAPAGPLFGLLDEGRHLHVWDWRTSRKVRQLSGISLVAFSRDGKRLAVAAGDVVRLYDVEAGFRERATLDAGEDVDVIAFSPDGKTIITSGNEVVFWDAATARRRGRSIARPIALEPQFNRDGTRVALRFWDDDAVQVCDTSTGWPLLRSVASDGLLAALAPDGKTLITMLDGRLMRIPIAEDSSSDPGLVARLAEAVAGGRVGDDGFAPTAAPELPQLAQTCKTKTDLACRFVGWFHDGYRTSTSPLAEVDVSLRTR